MFKLLKRLFTKHIGLKSLALLLAILSWFYITQELEKKRDREGELSLGILSSDGMSAKKLIIKPVIVGKPRYGYEIIKEKVIVSPEYCIVVGSSELLARVRFAYTSPIDIAAMNKTFTKSIPLNPIAPGVYMGDTLVQITIPIERTK